MFANRYTCLVDACSLAGVLRRNILLSLAEADFFRLRWSEEIISETNSALIKIFLKKGVEETEAIRRAQKSITSMCAAFPEATVVDYDAHLKDGQKLPDKNDAHVLAAAIKTRASMIVTENLKDFPQSILNEYWLEAKSADQFVADTIALDEGRAVAAIATMRRRFGSPALTGAQLLLKMESQGLIETVNVLSLYVDSI